MKTLGEIEFEYQQKRVAFVLDQLERLGAKANYLLNSYPRLSADLFNALRKNGRFGAVLSVGRPRSCALSERVSLRECRAPLSPPENGDNYLWCMRNHGVVYFGPFAGIYVGAN